MNPTIIGLLVFGFTFGGTLVGMILSTVMPEHHSTAESKDTVKIAIGLVATMTALVLGLVTASAKSSFDAMDAVVKHSAVDLLTLDRTLARYGPESREVRQALHDSVGQRLEIIWPRNPRKRQEVDVMNLARGAEKVIDQIRALSPKNDDQRWLRSRALDLGEGLLQARWAGMRGVGTSVPVPFLVVLVSWLIIIFTSFGLHAPRNTTAIVALLLCSLSVACAIFLILELDSPFDGIIQISPDSMRFAYSQLNK